MYLFRRKTVSPNIQLYSDDGQSMRMHMTFKNGEIHLNPAQLDRGTYRLTINRGDSRESMKIRID